MSESFGYHVVMETIDDQTAAMVYDERLESVMDLGHSLIGRLTHGKVRLELNDRLVFFNKKTAEDFVLKMAELEPSRVLSVVDMTLNELVEAT